MTRPMPEVLEDYDMDDPGYVRIRIRGCLWPEDAWAKAQVSSARAVRLLDDETLSPAIGVVHPPEVSGVSFVTSPRARGRRGDWEIVFESPTGFRGKISEVLAAVRERVVGEYVEDESAKWRLGRENTIKQVLTTTGNGPRRLRTGRRDEMSREMFPDLRLKNGLYDIVFTKGG